MVTPIVQTSIPTITKVHCQALDVHDGLAHLPCWDVAKEDMSLLALDPLIELANDTG